MTALHDEEEMASITEAGTFLGTPDYVAPEQAEDPHQADIRSDLYSLGATFYFLLAGKVPFPGNNLVQKLRHQLTDPTPSIADHRGGHSPQARRSDPETDVSQSRGSLSDSRGVDRVPG